MGLFFKRAPSKATGPKKGVTEQRHRRLSRIATSDLPSWAEQCTFEIGRCLRLLATEPTPTLYEDALLASETLTAIIQEMQRRVI